MYEFVISLLIVMILLKRFTNRVKRTNLQIPLPVTDSNQNSSQHASAMVCTMYNTHANDVTTTA